MWMTNVAENRINLFEEVKVLKEAEKKHFDAMWTVKEEKLLDKARLDEAKKAIKAGEAAWKIERKSGRRKRSI